MFAPKALDMFQKQMFPRQDSFTLLANSFNKENRLLNIFIWIRPEIIYPTMLKTDDIGEQYEANDGSFEHI